MKLTPLAGLLILGLCVAPTPAHAQDVLKTANIQRYYTSVRLFLQGAAIVMPEDKYGFKLDPAQMDFGQWINHATERNYVDCSTLRGVANPLPKAKVDLLKTKAEIVRNLQESFTYCDGAFETLDDKKILSSQEMTIAFLHTTVHNNEIYGNVVGYMRANHIVPPSTEMVQEMQKAKKTPAEMMKEMMERYNKKPGGF
jgi:hypothetical protein